MQELKIRNTCRLCGSRDMEIAFSLKASPIADAFVHQMDAPKQELYPLDLCFCNDCGHLQLIDVINPQILFKEYFFVTSSSLGLVGHFENYADNLIKQLNPTPGSLVIDIGSNDGTLLQFFKKFGMNVLGIDPAENIAEKANSQGIETIPSFFTTELAGSVKTKYGCAAIITANNVFAHADDMGAMAAGISLLLAEDGVFVFEVSYLVHIIERMLFDTIYHEHLCYHSVKPLVLFFKKYGMELIEVKYAETKGGSLHGMAQLKNGPKAISANVDELVRMEEQKGYDKINVYQRFYQAIEDVKKQLKNMLLKIKSRGESMAGYGSSQTCTTLSCHFEINVFFDFIADDNPDKHGLFSPGDHIPILPSNTLYEKNPDYVIILAWQYASPIIKRHETFIMNGGKFIVPLPTPLVVSKDNLDVWKNK